MAKTFKTMALLEQAFIKDTDKDVASVIKEATAALGEKIQVRRFEKCALLPLVTPPAQGSREAVSLFCMLLNCKPVKNTCACCLECGLASIIREATGAHGRPYQVCRTEGCTCLNLLFCLSQEYTCGLCVHHGPTSA